MDLVLVVTTDTHLAMLFKHFINVSNLAVAVMEIGMNGSRGVIPLCRHPCIDESVALCCTDSFPPGREHQSMDGVLADALLL